MKRRKNTALYKKNQIAPMNSPKVYEAKTHRTEEHIGSSIIVGDFIATLSVMDKQKINKQIEDLNNTINQLDLVDIYRILYP